ncbi:hypothetical protein EXIGLDRAFT_395986 [Exidia glandulosa HHB12029]|uniref:Uncharacterized protein n=1 Tax=Exidia glandulosa HHB12029 TaxID=1314781 RepID=A0A165BNS5_EXIGL|nr:hypothetical protein EXIGLDRAFT_395986 [Exidia glandulosa HHB12029]
MATDASSAGGQSQRIKRQWVGFAPLPPGVPFWDVLSGKYRDDGILQMDEDTLRLYLNGNVEESNLVPAPGIAAVPDATSVPLQHAVVAIPSKPTKRLIKIRCQWGAILGRDIRQSLAILFDPSATLSDLRVEVGIRLAATSTHSRLEYAFRLPDGMALDDKEQIQDVLRPEEVLYIRIQ